MNYLRLSLCFCVLLAASSAHAQSVPVNPTAIEFNHEDFAAVDKYVLGYFASADSNAPVQEADLQKPVNCSPCAGPLVSRPTSFQSWHVAVRAVAGTISSAWSERVPFVRAPQAPSSLRVR